LRSVVSAARAVSNMLNFRPKHSAVHSKSSSALASLAISTEIELVARIDTGSSKIFTKYWLFTTLKSSRKERSKTRQDRTDGMQSICCMSLITPLSYDDHVSHFAISLHQRHRRPIPRAQPDVKV
jgi:hypothetical protein